MPTAPTEGTVLIVEDHALFAETLAITLRLEGYDVRRPTLTRDLDVLASRSGCGPASHWSTWTSASTGTARA